MNGFRQFSDLISQFSMRHKGLIWLACTLIAVMTATGAVRLTPASDYRVFFTPDNPQRIAYEAINEAFTRNDNILLAIEPADGNVFNLEFMTRVAEVTQQLWQLPYVIRVDSISNFQHSSATDDNLVVADLFDPASNTSGDLEQIQEIALAEPQLLNRLINSSSSMTGINVSVLLPGKNPMTETPQVVNGIRDLAQQLEKDNPGLKTYLTGVIMLNNAFAEASLVDMSSLIPGVFLLVLLILALLLRNLKSLLICVLVMFYSIIMAMGFAGWMGYPMTPPMAIVPIIIMTLAVANSVHILLPALRAMQNGITKAVAIQQSIQANGYAVFLTSITTAMGFLSLNTTEVLPFHHLGNSAAFGVLIAFIFSITLLPALFMAWPIKVKIEKTNSVSMQGLANFVIQHYRALLAACLLITLVIGSFISKNEINENLIEYFDPAITFRGDSDYIAQHLTGTGFIDYSLNTQVNGVSDPRYLSQLENFSQWLKQQPDVLNVQSITDRLKQLNMNMHNDKPLWYKLPEKKDLAAQYLLLYEMSLPFGLDLNNQVNLEKSATRVSVTVNNISAKQYIDLDQRASQWLEQHAPRLATIGSGPTMMFSHISINNAYSMLVSATLALIGISFVMFLALGSISTGLISLVPNLLPIATAFGLWGLLNGEIGLGLSLVAATSLGIIVDDTVHFLTKYTEAKKQLTMTTEDAIRYAFDKVGPALLTTSVALIAGFMILYFSVFKLNSDMGILTATTLAIALVLDFLLLPALLLGVSKS
ncbi:MAG: MMPL family transporter [Gammaproteobacteria bacterium]|nr:MMPL family transporter [Gammaproteobacteria bacterium]